MKWQTILGCSVTFMDHVNLVLRMGIIRTCFLGLGLLIFTCSHAQDEGQTFIVKGPVRKLEKKEGAIIPLVSYEVKNGEIMNPFHNYRIVTIGEQILFQEKDREFSKTGDTMFIPSKTIALQYEVDSAGLLHIIKTDSLKGDKNKVIFSVALNKKFRRPLDWLSAILRDSATSYDYSVCTDTNATVKAGSKKIICYCIESYSKGSILAPGKYKSTTYIDKQHLLLVSEIHEFTPKRRPGGKRFRYGNIMRHANRNPAATVVSSIWTRHGLKEKRVIYKNDWRKTKISVLAVEEWFN
jgi:hypothetical protein